MKKQSMIILIITTIVMIYAVMWQIDMYSTKIRNKPVVPPNPQEYFSISSISYDEENNLRLILNVLQNNVGNFFVAIGSEEIKLETGKACSFYIKKSGIYALDKNLCNYGKTGGDPIEPLYPLKISESTIPHTIRLCNKYGCQEALLPPFDEGKKTLDDIDNLPIIKDCRNDTKISDIVGIDDKQPTQEFIKYVNKKFNILKSLTLKEGYKLGRIRAETYMLPHGVICHSYFDVGIQDE